MPIDVDQAPPGDERLQAGGEQAVGHVVGGLRVGHVAEQDRELVAADAGQFVAHPKARSQPLRHGHQHLVAGLVPVGVVDLFEAVEVAERNREVSLADGQRLGQAIPEQRAVGDSGEGVVTGQVHEALVLGPAEERELHVGGRPGEHRLVAEQRVASDVSPHRQGRRREALGRLHGVGPAADDPQGSGGGGGGIGQLVDGHRQGLPGEGGAVPGAGVGRQPRRRDPDPGGSGERGAVEAVVHDHPAGLELGGDGAGQVLADEVEGVGRQERSHEPVEVVLLVPGAESEGDPLEVIEVRQGHGPHLAGHVVTLPVAEGEHHGHADRQHVEVVDLLQSPGGEVQRLGGQELDHVPSDRLGGGPAEELLDARARVGEVPLGIDDDERVSGPVEEDLGDLRREPTPIAVSGRDDVET